MLLAVSALVPWCFVASDVAERPSFDWFTHEVVAHGEGTRLARGTFCELCLSPERAAKLDLLRNTVEVILSLPLTDECKADNDETRRAVGLYAAENLFITMEWRDFDNAIARGRLTIEGAFIKKLRAMCAHRANPL